MISVRKNVFETNSSSMHTIAICKDKTEFNPIDISEEEIAVIDGKRYLKVIHDDFYRSFNVLQNFQDKLPYILQWAASDCGSGPYDLIDLIVDLVKEKTGLDGIYSMNNEYYQYEVADDCEEDETCLPSDAVNAYGHVADQYDILFSYIHLVKETKEFETDREVFEYMLFSNSFLIVTDSDEVCQFDEMLDSGAFGDNIEYVLDDDYVWNENPDKETDWDYKIKTYLKEVSTGKKYLENTVKHKRGR